MFEVQQGLCEVKIFSHLQLFLQFFLHLVFLLALIICRVSIFSSSFLSHLSSLLAIFFSCFFLPFLFKQWLLLQALVLFQTQALFQMMMRSCVTWIKRLQYSFMQGLLLVLMETCSIQQRWRRGWGILWTQLMVFEMCQPHYDSPQHY